MRAFVRLREALTSNRELAAKLDTLEQKTELLSLQHETFAGNTRAQLKQVFEALRQLMTPPAEPPKRPIGFVSPEEKPRQPKAAKERRNPNKLSLAPLLTSRLYWRLVSNAGKGKYFNMYDSSCHE